MRITILKKLSKTIVALSLPLSVLLSAPVTQAYDVKSYGGANCQAYFGSQEGDLTKAVSGIYNASTAYKWVSCGIVQDKLFTATSNAGTVAFWVYVNNPNATRTYCYLQESNTNGSAVQVRAGNVVGNGWINLDTSSSSSFGSRTLYCYLPTRGRLSHIRTYEYTPSDSNS